MYCGCEVYSVVISWGFFVIKACFQWFHFIMQFNTTTLHDTCRLCHLFCVCIIKAKMTIILTVALVTLLLWLSPVLNLNVTTGHCMHLDTGVHINHTFRIWNWIWFIQIDRIGLILTNLMNWETLVDINIPKMILMTFKNL